MSKKNRSFLITGLTAVVFLGIGLLCPLMYDLNDDVTLRSILSGSYTGSPDGHAVYMKYPLTGLISLLYRACRPVPWFDLVMAGFFVLSVSAVMCRTASLLDVRGSGAEGPGAGDPGEMQHRAVCRIWKVLVMAGMAFLCAGLYLMNFLKMHYTLVAAMLGGAALYLVVTGAWGDISKQTSWKELLRESILPVLLLALCYDVRSQVFFLLAPFLGVAVLWQAWNGRLLQLIPFGALLVAVMALCMVWNAWMYRDSGWKEYEAYNESRTLLYDYTEPLPYEENRELYEDLGISPDRHRLLLQYDTALDNSVDQELLQKAADASVARREEQRSQKEYIRDCLVEYYYYVRYTGRPYNYFVILGYLAVLLLAAMHKKPGQLLLALCMGAGRSLIWVYLIWKGRFPERIYVSLFLIELMLLAGMVLGLVLQDSGREKDGEKAWKKDQEKDGEKSHDKDQEKYRELNRKSKGLFSCAAACLLCLALAFFAGERFAAGYQRMAQQQKIQEEWDALQEYCGANVDETYLLDVTSMVAYSGRQYEAVPVRQNYLLAGGWMASTPLLEERFSQLGVSDGAQALVKEDHVKLIAKADRDIGWLEEYMVRRFGACRMEKADSVELNGQEIFAVYQFSEG